MKNILVAGGNGFIGSNLIKELLNEKKIRVFSTIYNKKNNFAKINKNINYKKVDLLNIQDCLKVTKNMDIVVMCAANSAGAKIMKNNPLEQFRPNILMNLNMLEASYMNKIKKFIFISSNAVYPVSKKKMSEVDVDNTFFKGYFIPAWMKRISEISCDIYSNKIKRKMITIIVRPGNLYGPMDKFDKNKAKVIPSLIRKIFQNKKKLEVRGNGKDLKDFLYIKDFTAALMKIIMTVEKHSYFNVASGKSISINHIIKKLLKITRANNCKIIYQKNMPTMIPLRKIDIKKISKKLGWRPMVSLEEGLEKTINFYKSSSK